MTAQKYEGRAKSPRLDNKIIQPGLEVGGTAGVIQCRDRMGRVLRYYFSFAAATKGM
jgi:hypothetical protein